MKQPEFYEAMACDALQKLVGGALEFEHTAQQPVPGHRRYLPRSRCILYLFAGGRHWRQQYNELRGDVKYTAIALCSCDSALHLRAAELKPIIRKNHRRMPCALFLLEPVWQTTLLRH